MCLVTSQLLRGGKNNLAMLEKRLKHFLTVSKESDVKKLFLYGGSQSICSQKNYGKSYYRVTLGH